MTYRETSDYTVYEVGGGQSLDLVIHRGKSVSDIAATVLDAVYAQNGPFAWHDGTAYNPLGHIVKDGTLIQRSQSTGKWSAFVVPTAGRPYIGRIDPANVSGIKLAFQSTPQIVRDGRTWVNATAEGTPADVKRSTQRSAIGVKPDGTVVLVTTKRGYTLDQLAALMVSLGCVEALNLDGGGSVTRNVGRAPKTGYERPVSAAIIVKKSKEAVKPMPTPILVIDPGHGGADPGATANGLREKDFTLQISMYQYARLQQLGVPVILTRKEDVTLDPGPRAKLVKESGAKYCISNHINAGGGRGVETIHSIYSNGKLARKLFDAVVAAGQTGRRVFTRTLPNNPRLDYYYMHRDTGAVETVILEYAFIDNGEDVARLQANWQAWAEAVVKAFCEFVGHPYTPPKNSGNTPPESLTEALDVLVREGIVSSPEYWIANAVAGKTVSGEYAALLIENTAKKLEEMRNEIDRLEKSDCAPCGPDCDCDGRAGDRGDGGTDSDGSGGDPSGDSGTGNPGEHPKEPVNYPPCFLGLPGPCVRADGTIDWKGEKPAEEPEQPIQPTPSLPSWDETIERVKNATVYLSVKHFNYGTGWHIGNGFIVTAAHVVHNQDQLYVWYRNTGKRNFYAQKVAIHPLADLAIYRVPEDDRHRLPVALQIARELPPVGTPLALVGHEKRGNWIHETGGTLENPRINANGKHYFTLGGEYKADGGNSGGPVFMQDGTIVGILILNDRTCVDLTKYLDWIEEYTK